MKALSLQELLIVANGDIILNEKRKYSTPKIKRYESKF